MTQALMFSPSGMTTFMEWRAVVEYEGLYEVSDTGLIRQLVKRKGTWPGKVLKQHPARHGYLAVRLSKNNKLGNSRVHRIVAEAFIGPCPVGLEVNHRDGDRTHNHWHNLEYVSHIENVQHAHKTGLAGGSKSWNAKLTEAKVRKIRELIGAARIKDIAATFRVNPSVISNIKAGRIWKRA